ncbi:lipase family protein [Pseudarthrobacter raffinosi]|uniref:lipase family protein n=1 Tax=Pseudarthrobacter raffinosi TaxID=2953651 RepID=UPI00208E9FA8|nr:lipase family protein [Pseudarthrobacter sp. MDT3-9]MCO4253230.1 lipase family protein [Pseudarthrobacter sp. MDT3-9]
MRNFQKRSRTVTAALLASLLTVLSAGGVAHADIVLDPAVNTVPHPLSDAFYAQPKSFGGKAAGEILNSRQVTVTQLGVPVPFEAHQVQYVSTDTVGKAQANVATILKPLNTTGAPKLVSYQTPINSLSYSCDPSYRLRNGSEDELRNIETLLAQGWTVVVPDFLGPDHQWAAGYVEAKGTLDGIRAAIAFAPAGLSGTATPVGLTGYSGGARGTAYANELAGAYAPELNIVGAAPGGLAVNVKDVFRGANGGAFAGVYFAGLLGLDRAYPEMRIDSLLSAEGKKMKEDIGSMCIEEFIATYATQSIESYTVDGIDPLNLAKVQSVMNEIEGGQYGRPNAPVHFYMASHDELVVPANADKLVQHYCEEGVKVQYIKYPGEHVTAQVTGFPGAVAWLADRFAGKPAPSSC